VEDSLDPLQAFIEAASVLLELRGKTLAHAAHSVAQCLDTLAGNVQEHER